MMYLDKTLLQNEKQHVLLLSLASFSEWHAKWLESKRWYTFLLSPLWLCLLIAFTIRILLIMYTHNVIEGDEALVAIQAERILHGDFPVYFYGQPYMGSLEAYLTAVLFALFGPSVWALRLEGTLLSLLLVWLTWRLAKALAESANLPKRVQLLFMTVAALCAAIPPLYDGVMELHMLGGYIETFVLMLLLLLSAFQLTRRWRAGARSRELIWRWVGIGFVVGLGLWVDPLIISAVLASGIWILGNCILEMRKRRHIGSSISGPWWQPARELLLALVALPSSLLGLAPALGWGATHQWANVTYILNLSEHQTLRQTISNTLQATQSFESCVLPRLVGGSLPIESSLVLAIHTCLFVIGCVSILSTLLLLLWACFQSHSYVAPVRRLAGLPVLFAFCSVCLYCLSPYALFELHTCMNDFSGRYATPTALALPFLFATSFTFCWWYLHSKKQSVSIGASQTTFSIADSQRSYRKINLFSFSQMLLLLLALGFLGTQALSYKLAPSSATYQSVYCPQDPFDSGPVLAYLQKQGIRYFWANNFLAYPLVFKSNLSIIGSDPQTLIFAAIPNNPNSASNRIPSYTDAVLHADRPSILLVVPHNDSQPQVFRALDKLHVTYRAARFYGQPGYDVMVITPISRTVSPLVFPQVPVFLCTVS